MPNLEFVSPKNRSNIIKVLGVGGGGSNAVSYMFQQGIKDVDFVICNTDAQALELSPVTNKIQLGSRGLGAGAVPDVGREATLENINEIKEILKVNTNMLFITAGMGGGTGTGGAPVIAQAARELDILTVGIVTMPFMFEGRKRRMQALAGIEEMRKYVDTLLVINNDKLRELHGDLRLSQAFNKADNVLTTAARGIAEIITVPGYVNVDFEDVKTVMKNSGKAIMGSAIAEGENRAIVAVQNALNSPLLDDNNIKGASDILLYITSGTEEISMDEVSAITDYIQNEAGQSAEILWGNGIDASMETKVCVTIIATGFDAKKKEEEELQKRVVVGTIGPNPVEQPKAPVVEPEKEAEQEIKLIKPKPAENKPNFTEQATFLFDVPIVKQKKEPEPSPKAVPSEEPMVKEPDQVIFEIKKQTDFVSVRPPVEEPKPEVSGNDTNDQERRAQERVQKLRDLSIKLKTPGGLAELEREPAYVRKKMELADPPPVTGSQTSRFVLNSDENNNTDIRSNNSYLHDNVD